jgi:serine/threonine-protein kinase RIO1
LIGHDYAKKYLFRDIQNITNYFTKLGVDTEEPEVITKHIVTVGET